MIKIYYIFSASSHVLKALWLRCETYMCGEMEMDVWWSIYHISYLWIDEFFRVCVCVCVLN